jgi:hypothetical protein
MTEQAKNFFTWILEKLGENSTWRGLITIATAAGATWAADPVKSTQIISAGIALVGLINVFRQGAPSKSQVAAALKSKQDKALGDGTQQMANGRGGLQGTVLGLGIMLCLTLSNGCGTLDPAGPYHGDKVLYQTDGAITSSYELMHSFVAWELRNRAGLAGQPEITRAADNIRRHAKQWIGTATALRDAYAANPGPEHRALDQALAVLNEAAKQSAAYLLAAAGPATVGNGTNTPTKGP